MRRLFGSIWFLVGKRQLVWNLTVLELRVRYAGSRLGLLWVLLSPFLTLGTYLLLFQGILAITPATTMGRWEYGVSVACGLLPWLGFAEGLIRGTMSVLSNRELLKSSLFPAAMPPVAAVLAGLMVQILGTGILIAVLTWRGSVSVSLTAMPLIVLFQALFTIGTVWILSCVNILYRDTSPVLTHTLTLLMFLSPIAYTSQMVPDNLAIIVRLNPLAYLIDGYRTILLEQQFPSVGTLATFGILAVFVLEAGHRYFNRLRGLLSDHV